MIQSQIMKITPQVARDFLSNNSHNRPMNKNHVANLAGAMSRGEWQLNGESIKVSECGALLDGQHRLSAIVKTGVAIDMIVITGLPLASFHTINVGAKLRGAGDVLAIAGEKNWNVLAAGARAYKIWESNKAAPKFQGHNISVQEIEGVIQRHPNLRLYAYYKKDGLKRMMPPAVLCFLAYVFHRYDNEKADQFFNGLITGFGLQKGSPILLLRDRLILNSASQAKLSREVICALTIKAFNAFVENKSIGVLRYSESEKFPLIVGA